MMLSTWLDSLRYDELFFFFYLLLTNAVFVISAAGTLIRRHRIPLPPPNDDEFYNVFHFNINQQMVLYSRIFTVTSCDSFTKNFLTKLGVQLNDPAAVPDDPYSKLRKKVVNRRHTTGFVFFRFLFFV